MKRATESIHDSSEKHIAPKVTNATSAGNKETANHEEQPKNEAVICQVHCDAEQFGTVA